MKPRVSTIVFIVYAVILGLLLLWPTHPDATIQPFTVALLEAFSRHWLTAWITIEPLNDLANVALFLPFGLLATLVFGRNRWWIVAIAGAALSFAVEVVQGLLLPGRVPDIQDALSGTVGIALGVAIAAAITAGRARRRTKHSITEA